MKLAGLKVAGTPASPSPLSCNHPMTWLSNHAVNRPCTQACLIDFDFSEESSDPNAQAAELEELRALFRRSDADTSPTSGM
jgi:hypothetical protein